MIKRLTTFMHQIRRDYTFWSVMLSKGGLSSWIAKLFNGACVQAGSEVDLDSSTLLPQSKNQPVGCGAAISIIPAGLDALWRRTIDQRSPSPTATPFQDAVQSLGLSTVQQAVMISELLFGVRDFVDQAGNATFVNERGVAVGDDQLCAVLCFAYNIINGTQKTVFIEPCHKYDAFWLQVDQGCAPHQALLGLAWIMSASSNRHAQIVEVLRKLSQQVSQESWTSSLFSWFAAQETTSPTGAGTVNMNPWTLLARAILLGSPLVQQHMDVEGSVTKAISPYEDPIEFIETGHTDVQVQHITGLPGSHVLVKALRTLKTPLSRGCLPPIAIYQLVWDVTSNEVEAKHIDYHEIKSQQPGGCYMAFDVRGALQGSHTQIPRDRFPECCILGLLSLTVDTPFMQNYVAATQEWAATLQQMWPHLQGKFAVREVEKTLDLLGIWEMRDQVPEVGEYGTIEWLFTNSGLAISPRARTGTAAVSLRQLPRAFTVDGVRLQLDTANMVTVNYRRV